LADAKEEMDKDDALEEETKIDENEVEYSKTSFIIPSCSAWFNIDKIHEIEMQTLPEWFCGKFPHKNPTTYMDYRNYIIKLYREAPNSYLSATCILLTSNSYSMP
jgi:SWI/SNF complex subunit SWI3